MRRIAGVLLAAGVGARFGGHKLLAPLANGTALGVAAARCLRGALPDVLAVVRPGDTELSRLLAAEGVRVMECPDAEQGMGRSLAAGVAATPGVEGWLVALADMPYIKTSTCMRVTQALIEDAVLAAPFHNGRRGHPVGFSAALKDELLALRGDRGARDLLERHRLQLARIAVDDPGIFQDIDVPADLMLAAG